MILKLRIEFCRWLWGLPPLDTADPLMVLTLNTGAWFNIVILAFIIRAIIIAIKDRW